MLLQSCYKNKHTHTLFLLKLLDGNEIPPFESLQDLLSELEESPLHFLTNPCHKERGVLCLARILDLLCESTQKNSALRSLTGKDLVVEEG